MSNNLIVLEQKLLPWIILELINVCMYVHIEMDVHRNHFYKDYIKYLFKKAVQILSVFLTSTSEKPDSEVFVSSLVPQGWLAREGQEPLSKWKILLIFFCFSVLVSGAEQGV